MNKLHDKDGYRLGTFQPQRSSSVKETEDDDGIHWTTFTLIFCLLGCGKPWWSKCPKSVPFLVLYFAI